MRWSVEIARLGGTTVRLHMTFLLLLAWVAAARGTEGGAAAALDGVLFVSLVFLCVVLHEFGHAAMARRYGIKTPDITLFPIGGVARLERMPERPGREIAVALAGPAVNVVIAAGLFLILGARFDLSDIAQLEAAQMSMTGRLAAVNVLLVAFNLIPAFPTDGGRVFRALLAFRFGRVAGTRYAAAAGQVFAILFVVIGLLGNPILALIGVFLFLAGDAETRDVTQRAAARDHAARDAMIVRYETLSPQNTAEDAARLLLLTTQQEFPVLDEGGGFRGFATRRKLIEAMRDPGPDTPVARFMDADPPIVSPNAPLTEVMDALGRSEGKAVAVLDATERLLGYVSRENLGELFMLAEAAEARRAG
jgi:stage IV sporulation protein FB